MPRRWPVTVLSPPVGAPAKPGPAAVVAELQLNGQGVMMAPGPGHRLSLSGLSRRGPGWTEGGGQLVKCEASAGLRLRRRAMADRTTVTWPVGGGPGRAGYCNYVMVLPAGTA